MQQNKRDPTYEWKIFKQERRMGKTFVSLFPVLEIGFENPFLLSLEVSRTWALYSSSTKTMAALIQIPFNFPAVNTPRRASIGKNRFYGLTPLKRGNYCAVSSVKIGSFYPNGGKFGAFRDGSCFWEVSRGEVGVFLKEERRSEKRRVVLVRFNSLDGGDGGGGRDNSETVRVLGNIALAIVLTYLTVTGQLGWVFDAIVSVWVSLCLYNLYICVCVSLSLRVICTKTSMDCHLCTFP